jgi:hypothetical protein
VYLVINGRERRHVIDPETFDACNFHWGRIKEVRMKTMMYQSTPIDINSFVTQNECEAYYISSMFSPSKEESAYMVLGNTIRYFRSTEEWNNVMKKDISNLSVVKDVPKIGLTEGPELYLTSLERDSQGNIYLVSFYEKQLIANTETLEKCGFDLTKVKPLSWVEDYFFPTLPNNIDIHAYP